jgi:hypothetical protein
LKNDPTYHIDEQTLELFVLGAPEVEDQRQRILDHLGDCAVCRALEKDIQSIYTGATEDLREIEQRIETSSKTLIPVESSIQPYFEKIGFQRGLRPVGGLARVKQFVSRRPIVSAVGGFGLLAACLAGLVMFSNYRDINNNPDHLRIDYNSKTVSIFNKSNRMLWQLSAGFFSMDSANGAVPALVRDLDGDRTNEVVVSCVTPEEMGGRWPTLKVYNSDQSLRFEKSFAEKLHYGPYAYDEKLSTCFVLSMESGRSYESDIWTSCKFTRSPNSIIRIDPKGIVIGEYWHYGHFIDGYLTRIEGVNHNVGVFLGTNDASDTIDIRNDKDPIIAVVDLLKIEGKTESSATPGFGMKRSAAELYYIKLPISDMAIAIGGRSAAWTITSESDSLITVMLTTTSWGEYSTFSHTPSFDFCFNRRMELVAVKNVDENVKLHELLKKQYKITSTLDQRYLDNLKKRVRYWNGKEWQSEVTRVK